MRYNSFPSSAIPGKWIDCLTLFELDCEQEAAIKELFEARGWDYVHEISLPFLYFGQDISCQDQLYPAILRHI